MTVQNIIIAVLICAMVIGSVSYQKRIERLQAIIRRQNKKLKEAMELNNIHIINDDSEVQFGGF